MNMNAATRIENGRNGAQRSGGKPGRTRRSITLKTATASLNSNGPQNPRARSRIKTQAKNDCGFPKIENEQLPKSQSVKIRIVQAGSRFPRTGTLRRHEADEPGCLLA